MSRAKDIMPVKQVGEFFENCGKGGEYIIKYQKFQEYQEYQEYRFC
jgi:hypothetical protein